MKSSQKRLEINVDEESGGEIEISKLIEDFVARRGKFLIDILSDIQKTFNYLPEEVLKEVAIQLDMPLINVYGVATFHRQFSIKPNR